jgi:hypothetical protein
MTGVVGIPGSQQPLWYAGTLNLPSADSPGFGGFDEIYSCDDAFERRMKQLDGFLADCARRGVEYVSIFGCHPVRVMARGWIEEYCLVNGLTRTPEELGWLYAVKTPQEEAAAKANFRRLCQYLKGHPDLKMVGVEEAAKAFSSQPEDISRDELTAYADQVEQAGRAVLDRTFSPAEMVCGLADSLVHAEEHGDLPDAVGRRNVLGPTSLPVAGMEVYALSGEELVELARQTRAAVQSTGHLPANVNVPAGRVGLGQLAVMLARSYAALARYEKLQAVRVPKTTRYPDAAMTIDAWVRRSLGEHWPYALDFNCDRIAEHARLQTWTLKPAWLRPPRGAPYSEGRISIHK